jgi:CRISPR/Cas system CMR subunit Cmr4 (Cas7 group RAMP superfamily)
MPNTRLYWLHCLSPTHAGIGRGLSYIDLPIDRDAITNWPIIRGSGFKGVWADHHRATADARRNDPTLRAAFGVAGDDNNSNAGALIPTDAKLVCLPVRSFRDDEMKTVARGALWTEESLPAETILMGLIHCDRVFGSRGEDITPQGLLDRFAKEPLTLQIGGKATVGRGQVRCVFSEVN